MSSLAAVERRIAEALDKVAGRGGASSAERAGETVRICGLKGLTTEMVEAGQTPDRIARLWLAARLNNAAMPCHTTEERKTYPLLPYQKVLLHDMEENGEEMWTFGITLSTDRQKTDRQRLQAAFETAMKAHPVLHTRIDAEGQHHDASHTTRFFSFHIVEKDRLELHIRANRILGDATSFLLLLEDIGRAYRGEEIPYDAYLEFLAQHESFLQSQQYAQHGQLMEELYGGLSCPVRPKEDFCHDGPGQQGCHILDLSHMAERVGRLCREEKMTLNALFCLACSMAIMDYNNTCEAALTWAYAGRDNVQQQSIFGSLHRDVPFRIGRNRDTRRTELFDIARNEIMRGIELSDFPFTFMPRSRALWHGALNVLVQPSPTPNPGGIEWQIETADDSKPSYCMMDVEVCEQPLMLCLRYSKAHYRETSIARFARMIEDNVGRLLQDNIHTWNI